MQVIVIAIGIYLLYRFIFGFVIPVVKATNRMKKQFGAMKENVDPGFGQQQSQPTANRGDQLHKTTSGKPGSKEDYIEFEELK